MKNLLVVSFAFALLLTAFSGCNSEASKQNAESVATNAKYICPMNCEKGKTYDQPGSCPVCHMDLELVKAEVSANTAEYFSDFKTSPEKLEAGKPGTLTLMPKIKGNESAAVPLDLVHEKKMHLILVSDDLSWFDHIHPEYQANGAYEIKVLGSGDSFTNGRGHSETRFDAGGKFLAFADYKPLGALNQVNKIEFEVAGTPMKAMAFSQPKMTVTVDGYTLSLEAGHEGSGLTTGVQQHIPVSIKKGGKAIDPATFENYLGEKAHMILIEANTKAFIHTHPSAEGGVLDVHTTFTDPGIYRAWIQFQTEGKVHTADFVIKVTAGEPGKDDHDHDDHGHDHDDTHSGH